jgi:diguanylate cyclase (GGDEF)-like protein
VFSIDAGRNVIGRGQESQIRLSDDGISRRHACVTLGDGAAAIEDLESRNGTYVNGKRITAVTPLTEGDKLQLGGSTVLRFGLHDELDQSFHETLLSSALRDPLTKLYNKRFLMDRLDSELQFARRHETMLTVLMLDLDHFKQINDTHGHLAGDAVLENIAGALSRAVRNEDVVARFGGEELVVILRAISLDLGVQLGERLRRLIEGTITSYQERLITTTVSIGAAGFPFAPVQTVEQLLEAADRALYRAKDAGRNRVSR